MPVIPNIGNTIRAIERLTNDLSQGERRPRRGQVAEQPSWSDGAKETHRLLSEKAAVKEILSKQAIKANAKLIHAEDEIVGTIIDLKV